MRVKKLGGELACWRRPRWTLCLSQDEKSVIGVIARFCLKLLILVLMSLSVTFTIILWINALTIYFPSSTFRQPQKAKTTKAKAEPKAKKAKKADGEKKKRPLSGFMKFSQQHRAQVKEENPDISFGEVGRKLGEMWRALSDEEKEAFKTAPEE